MKKEKQELEKSDSQFIAMGFDPLFKKMYGDNNNPNKAAAIISLLLDIPFEDIKDNVIIINNEQTKQSKNDKKKAVDVLLHVILKSGNQYVNLEANLFNYSQNLINRNVGYLTNIFSNQLKSGDDYDLLEPVGQINFNIPDKKHKSNDQYRIIDEYLLRNEHGEVLTEMERIINIDIEKCYRLWYNEDTSKFSSQERTILTIGALHYIQTSREFRKCLGEINMDKEIKETIQHDMDEYQKDNSLAMAYDYEKHLSSLRKCADKELEEEKQRIIEENQRVIEEKQRVIEEKQRIIEQDKEIIERQEKLKIQEQEIKNQEIELKGQEENLKVQEEKLKVQGEKLKSQEERLKQEKMSFAKNLLNINTDIEEISRITNLTIEEIKKIDN